MLLSCSGLSGAARAISHSFCSEFLRILRSTRLIACSGSLLKRSNRPDFQSRPIRKLFSNLAPGPKWSQPVPQYGARQVRPQVQGIPAQPRFLLSFKSIYCVRSYGFLLLAAGPRNLMFVACNIFGGALESLLDPSRLLALDACRHCPRRVHGRFLGSSASSLCFSDCG